MYFPKGKVFPCNFSRGKIQNLFIPTTTRDVLCMFYCGKYYLFDLSLFYVVLREIQKKVFPGVAHTIVQAIVSIANDVLLD